MSGQLRGAGLMVLATMLIAASTLFAKALGAGDDPLSPIQVTWGRYVFGLCLILLLARGVKLDHPRWPLHMGRVGCGWLGVTCMFTAAASMPLGDVTAISFTNPIIAMVIAVPLLGERIGRVRVACAVGAMVGALLLIRPGVAGFQPVALVALLAALLFGFEVIFLKMLAGKERTMQVVLIANMTGAALSCTVVGFFWQAPSLTQWLLMIGVGTTMVCAQILFTNALRLGEAGFILPFSYATLVWATVYDAALFGTVPAPLSFAGGLIIIACGITLALREGRAKMPVVPSRPSA
ncbi:DMT family transporter [Pseudahrensia aquimaris]|uniref:DMT family transporter n=1 Tax=Pseudahrensia aquimaris TaxID=744461 RepID=A0ABW3FIB2_9HYPH